MLAEKLSTSESELEGLIEIGINKELESLKYVCKFGSCSKRFKRQTHLDRHEFHHDGIKKHVCLHDNCDKSYIISTHLKRHVQTFHEKFRKPKIFKCTVTSCNKSFDSLYNVERHIINFHKNLKLYRCKSCDEDFPRKLAMRRHEIKQHNAEYPYKCNACHKGYVQETHLKRHKCVQKDALYKCERCDKGFSKWSLLIEHSKSEHDKAIVCNCCGKEFHRKIDLQNHENSIKKKRENPNTKIECPYKDCGRTYNFKKNLNHHIKFKHLSKTYKCPFDQCAKELATKQKLNQHIQKMHNIDGTHKDKNKVKRSRKPRKDIGQSKRSLASRLSNVMVHTSTEIKVFSNEAGIVVLKEADVQNFESENDEKMLSSVVTLELEDP